MSDNVHKKTSASSREMAILNQYGIHARPAAMFVKTASKYEAEVTVEKDNVRVSGKSIMGLMTMEASCGTKIKITAEGVDADQALDELQKLVEHKFYEE
ncbi:MAG: HPr family phosphocarrier protein [Kiritimatiellae bacterium]|nr:HPr family phosphocarrier protein [Kiritimatiellia bacterium]